jgi:cobalt-zinc-cadmium resistance protein CzcA
VALLLIFLLLYFAFKSVKQGLLIYSAIPLSAIGGVLALVDAGTCRSAFRRASGFIALFGIAVLNGIVLIAEFNRLHQEGWNNVRRIVLQGTKIRLCARCLMTAAVASLGFLADGDQPGSRAQKYSVRWLPL